MIKCPDQHLAARRSWSAHRQKKKKKKKKQRAKLDPRTPAAARLKKKKTTCKTRPAHACGCAVNKPKVNLKPRTPAAARLIINRLPSINRPAYGCAVKNRALLSLRRLKKNTAKYLATTFSEKTLPGNS